MTPAEAETRVYTAEIVIGQSHLCKDIVTALCLGFVLSFFPLRRDSIEYSDSTELVWWCISCTIPAIQACNIWVICCFRKVTQELE